ncbi:alpha-amylase family glycosyl hydrolase [Paenibacillus montanisoli]|uniref:Alpha-amylase n=1 Tax=Paenibacillus montanisoli TaxID=2081970 RepID=A0A328TZQ5_9BACL|nr:alpha-amylase family glycosyl hydrolase [Paenibacillus montanisoli]RAP74075.1 alpha-amylase [Paenibacillus montanisoli]
MSRGAAAALSAALLLLALAGCSSAENNMAKTDQDSQKDQAAVRVDEQPGTVYYEIFVRSFYDSNGDGIGDLNGVTEKLSYLKELGIGGIWLMPVNPSPSYHGYDVTDYYGINKDYGTLDDLNKLTEAAHKLGIKVIMDLVVNHTSKEHPWFKEAIGNPDSKYRNWYRIEAADAQVPADGAVGGNPWHPYGSVKYLADFWEGMPDLNFDEPAVRSEIIKIGKYWLQQGVDGFRLDAAKHIYGDFASTINTDEVKASNRKWWQEFRSGIAGAKKDAFLIGEVWDSSVIIAPYLDNALDSAFNFDLAKKLLSGADREQNPDIAFSLGRIYDMYSKASNGKFVDAPFLTNHDQNRTMSELDGNVDHAKMAASLLLTLPGNPFIYYGEEIGMAGMKPDEAIREPMPWYASGTGTGQTTWEALLYNTTPKTVSVEAQQTDPDSLLSHYKKLIAWRNELPALRDGGIAELSTGNPAVAAYVRAANQEQVLVVHNLSAAEQTVDLTESGKASGIAFSEIARASKDGAKLDGGKLKLPAFSTVILQ